MENEGIKFKFCGLQKLKTREDPYDFSHLAVNGLSLILNADYLTHINM
jgi:hypothetical protein